MNRTIEKLSSRFIDELRSGFEKSFYFACKAIFEFDFRESWLYDPVHRSLCDDISNFKKNTRLGIILPRDWLKSQICSIYYPVWRAMLDENFTSMVVLNTFTNAGKKMGGLRGLLRNQLLRQMYPERMPDKHCKQTGEALCLPRRAALSDETFEIAGCGTEVTSRHIELLVEDDTIAPEKSRMTSVMMQPGKERIEQAIGFHKVGHFLLNDFKKSQRIVVGTRWVERDLFTHIMDNEPQYKIIQRACIENGKYTYPTRFDKEVLDEVKQAVGSYMFEALMMNNPLRSDDMVFSEESVRIYDAPPSGLLVFTSVDPAPQDSEMSSDPDYNVVLTAGLDQSNGDIYVLDYWRKRGNPGEVIQAIITQMKAYSPLITSIESVAYQVTLKWHLEQEMRKRDIWFRVEKSTQPKMQKTARIRGLQTLTENRQLFIRKWMEDLLHELVVFPRGAHDDIIDALAQQQTLWKAIQVKKNEEKYTADNLFSGGQLLEELYSRSKPRYDGYPHDLISPGSQGSRFREYILN